MGKVEKLKKLILLAIALLIAGVIAVRPANAIDPTTISVYPQTITDIEIGQTFQINITVNIGTNRLYMWVLSLKWDPSKINLVGDPIEGPFIKQATISFFTWSEVNNTNGYVRELVCTSLERTVSGSGVIATLNFIAVSVDGSVLELLDPELTPDSAPIWYDGEGTLYSFDTVNDGSVTVIPEFPAFMILPLLMGTTLLVIIITKTSWLKRRKNNSFP